MPKEKKNSIPAGKVHKGNAKPVSSSRMVDLLSTSGGMSNFGFTSSPSSQPFHQTDGEEEEQYTGDLEGKFHVVMKLLTKRDSQTKLKALQEFSVLCQNEPLENVFASRKVWVMIYNRLSLDVDHRVREACHLAMKHFVSKVKREFAPSLKLVIGCWVCAMSDPYPAVAASACSAFDSIFSKEKQIEVYKFAFSDILSHINELLSAKNLVLGRRFSSENERSLFLELAALQGLMGFQRFLHSLPCEFVELHLHDLNSLWRDKMLWTLAQHKCASVSTFLVCTGLCECITW
jgi:hypothetical protein